VKNAEKGKKKREEEKKGPSPFRGGRPGACAEKEGEGGSFIRSPSGREKRRRPGPIALLTEKGETLGKKACTPARGGRKEGKKDLSGWGGGKKKRRSSSISLPGAGRPLRKRGKEEGGRFSSAKGERWTLLLLRKK